MTDCRQYIDIKAVNLLAMQTCLVIVCSSLSAQNCMVMWHLRGAQHAKWRRSRPRHRGYAGTIMDGPRRGHAASCSHPLSL